MARLNEPPVAPGPAPASAAPSTEALEAIKRKFMRQNRELAKVNSAQSIRIRQLENDCSRLVADNLSLREQVLHLQNTVDSQNHAPSFASIDTVKNHLEAKIQELGGLVAELGQMNKRGGSPPCKSQPTATKISPEDRQWRSALGLQEVENAMMPTITEHKSYPRRTLNADEIHNILNDQDSQSPEIGPPPVSHFDIDDSFAFTPNLTPEDLPEQATEDEEPALPMNLETRRRRRESGPKANGRRVSLFEPPEDVAPVEEPLKTEPVKVIKTGAKRKFSVQQDEEKAPTSAEPFQFNRRNTPAPAEEGNADEEPASPRRPALSSKPVNTDPVLSPKKQRSSALEKSEKGDKPEKKKPGRTRMTITRRNEVPPPELPEPIPTEEIHLDSFPPKTPAAEPIFSPVSTEPSTSRTESKDTPPPGELGSMSQAGGAGRPSRRARPQVSYKEPSLSTKMRRPGKELVDAVTVNSARRTSVEPPSVSQSSARASDEQGGSPWRPMGAPAVRRADEEVEIGSPLRQKLDRKEGQDAKAEPPKLNSAAASLAISAMIEETRRKSLTSAAIQSSKETAKTEESHPDDLAIFDFTESSPPTAAPTSRPKMDLAKAVRAGRRHSSVPTSSAAPEDRKTEPTATAKADGTLPAIHRRTGSGNVKPAPVMGLAKSTAAARASAKERRTSALTSTAKGDTEARDKVERAGARRRSMVV